MLAEESPEVKALAAPRRFQVRRYPGRRAVAARASFQVARTGMPPRRRKRKRLVAASFSRARPRVRSCFSPEDEPAPVALWHVYSVGIQSAFTRAKPTRKEQVKKIES
jgi:hypothetical protein